jgi:hypothetical protein
MGDGHAGGRVGFSSVTVRRHHGEAVSCALMLGNGKSGVLARRSLLELREKFV